MTMNKVTDYSEFQFLYKENKKRFSKIDTNCLFPGKIIRDSIANGQLFYRSFPEGLVLYIDEINLYRAYYFLDAECQLPDMSADKIILIEELDDQERRKEYLDKFRNKLETAGFFQESCNYQLEVDLLKNRDLICENYKNAFTRINISGLLTTCEPNADQNEQILQLWKNSLKQTDVPISHTNFYNDNEQHVICVTDPQGNVCGVNWWTFRGNCVEIRHTVTHPNYYHKGIGNFIMSFVLNTALNEGVVIGMTYVEEQNYRSFGMMHKAGLKENGRVSYQFLLENKL